MSETQYFLDQIKIAYDSSNDQELRELLHTKSHLLEFIPEPMKSSYTFWRLAITEQNRFFNNEKYKIDLDSDKNLTIKPPNENLPAHNHFVIHYVDPALFDEKEYQELALHSIYTNRFSIKDIQNLTRPMYTAATKKWSGMLQMFKEQQSWQVEIAIADSLGNFKYVDNPTPELCLYVLSIDGKLIRFIDNPTDKMIKRAIDSDYRSIRYTNTHEPKYFSRAISKSGLALQHIPEEARTPELCLRAVKKAGTMLHFVPEEYRTEEICNIALRRAYTSYHDIPNPTEEMNDAVVKRNPYMLEYVKEQTEEQCLAAIKKSPYTFTFVKQQTAKICIAALEKNRYLTHMIRYEQLTEEDKYKVEKHIIFLKLKG